VRESRKRIEYAASRTRSTEAGELTDHDARRTRGCGQVRGRSQDDGDRRAVLPLKLAEDLKRYAEGERKSVGSAVRVTIERSLSEKDGER
jgi:hypothetical protein